MLLMYICIIGNCKVSVKEKHGQTNVRTKEEMSIAIAVSLLCISFFFKRGIICILYLLY